MTIAIVDDSPVWRERIRDCVKDCLAHFYADFELLESGDELLKLETVFDIVFLDVEMEGLDGFETARSYLMLHPESYIVMLTMHGELSSRGYEVDAFRYIDKSNMEEGIREAWNCLQLRVQTGQRIRLKVFRKGEVELSENEIVSIETVHHGVIVNTVRSRLHVAATISQLSRMLDQECFFRTHHSWIVNWKYLEEIEGSDVRMLYGPTAMLAQSRASAAKKHLWQYGFRRGRG